MVGKFTLKCTKLVWFLFLSLSFESSLIAMDSEEEQDGVSELVFDDYKNIERYDPVFYRVTMDNGTEIYFLGYTHSIPPKIFLSEPVYNTLLDLSHRSVLFVEHPSTPKYLLKMLQTKLSDTENHNLNHSSNEWIAPLNLNPAEEEIWDKIKGQDFSEKINIKIEEISKLHLAEGAMLLGSIPSMRIKKMRPGIGAVLRSWTWHGDIQTLETVEQAIEILKEEMGDIHDYFSKALFKFEKNGSDKSIESYIKSTGRYSHQKYFNTPQNKIKPSTLHRNVNWGRRIKGYLTTHTDPKVPILIVCGSAHLAGGLNQWGLLAQILEGEPHKKIERMTKNGQWVDFNLPESDWD